MKMNLNHEDVDQLFLAISTLERHVGSFRKKEHKKYEIPLDAFGLTNEAIKKCFLILQTEQVIPFYQFLVNGKKIKLSVEWNILRNFKVSLYNFKIGSIELMSKESLELTGVILEKIHQMWELSGNNKIIYRITLTTSIPFETDILFKLAKENLFELWNTSEGEAYNLEINPALFLHYEERVATEIIRRKNSNRAIISDKNEVITYRGYSLCKKENQCFYSEEHQEMRDGPTRRLFELYATHAGEVFSLETIYRFMRPNRSLPGIKDLRIQVLNDEKNMIAKIASIGLSRGIVRSWLKKEEINGIESRGFQSNLDSKR